jgi:hypothetical protein
MWALNNRTPYGAERCWLRDSRGAYHFVVAVRVSFALDAAGKLELADEQLAPRSAPEFEGDPGLSSLKYESDLGAMPPTTEVVVRAHAHAPRHQATERVPVSLRVGAVYKQLLVHGERRYRADGLTLTEPAPFVSAPIRYEHAYGGSDSGDSTPGRRGAYPRNPVGCGYAIDPRTRAGALAHTIEYPVGDPAVRGPAGFGPIAAHWSPRRERAGTFDDAWHTAQRPLLPLDYDPGFALAAPEDQQLPDYLVGAERVELLGMSPEGALGFTLPSLALLFSTRIGLNLEQRRARLVSVSVEPEERRLGLLYKSALRVPARDVERLDEVTIEEGKPS